MSLIRGIMELTSQRPGIPQLSGPLSKGLLPGGISCDMEFRAGNVLLRNAWASAVRSIHPVLLNISKIDIVSGVIQNRLISRLVM